MKKEMLNTVSTFLQQRLRPRRNFVIRILHVLAFLDCHLQGRVCDVRLQLGLRYVVCDIVYHCFHRLAGTNELSAVGRAKDCQAPDRRTVLIGGPVETEDDNPVLGGCQVGGHRG